MHIFCGTSAIKGHGYYPVQLGPPGAHNKSHNPKLLGSLRSNRNQTHFLGPSLIFIPFLKAVENRGQTPAILSVMETERQEKNSCQPTAA